MKITGLQKVSLIDYPGYIAATVFLAGCNLDCGYCHNRWMIDASQIVAAMSEQDFLAWLKTRHGRLGGVCVSGGEPTLQGALPELLQAIKALGYAVKLDTNGTLPERLDRLLQRGLVDYVAMDLKAPLDERYSGVAGVVMDLDAIRRSMAILRDWGGAYEYRTTVLPSLAEPALAAIAAELTSFESWYLQRYIPVAGVASAPAPAGILDEQSLQALAQMLQGAAPGVKVRGAD
jgi:pyruvate formate lyase activating enzyme